MVRNNNCKDKTRQQTEGNEGIFTVKNNLWSQLKKTVTLP